MSRILVLNLYYPPDESATSVIAADVVHALVAAGHQVTVLAGRPSYGARERLAWRWRRVQQEAGPRVVRVGSSAFTRARIRGRLINYLSYLLLVAAEGWRTRTDGILAMTDPPVAVVVGAVLAWRHRVPLIYNVRDLHPDMAVASGMVRAGIVTRFWDWLHRRAARSAALVIALGDDMRERIISKGLLPERVIVIRDGARAAETPRDAETHRAPDASPAHQLTTSVPGAAPFVVMHAGNLGFAGDWEALLTAAGELAADNVTFVFAGDGAARATLAARSATLPNVRFVPPVPATDYPALLAAGDVQIVTVRKGLEGLVVPSKLYPLLFAGRPVLAVAPPSSDVSAIVREHRCGWTVDPGNSSGIVAAVREAMRDRAALRDRGNRARHAAARFDRDALLIQYVRAVGRVLSPQGTS